MVANPARAARQDAGSSWIGFWAGLTLLTMRAVIQAVIAGTGRPAGEDHAGMLLVGAAG